MTVPVKSKATSLIIEVLEDANWLGGSIYIDNLLATLSKLPVEACPSINLRLLSSPASALAIRLSGYAVVSQALAPNFFGKFIAGARRIHRSLLRRIPSVGFLMSAPCNELYFPVFDVAQQWRKNLYWIPDFQPHHLPELFEPKELLSRKKNFRDIANQNGIVILSSKAALVDFKKFYPDATIEPRVWSFCSSIEAGYVKSSHEVLNRYALPEKFLYIANQFWRHKDHATAFKALRILRDKGIKVTLVCTGLENDRRDPAYFDTLKSELEHHGLLRQVFFLGVVPREDQIQFFRASVAVLQPSRFEGWSTVIEDAKALGRPIIASDIAVHQEQLAGLDGVQLFKTSCAHDLADHISKLWPVLQNGPNPDSEMLAVKHRNLKRLESARRFVDIVDEALAYPRSAEIKKRKNQ
jgi:glycosyltransferase involved in cell wall biosynthesis